MVSIETRPVTADNWLDAIALAVHPEQQSFVPSIAISLAKAYIKPEDLTYDPIAVYAEGAMVGFYSFMHKAAHSSYCSLEGMLIDKKYQGHGYGKAAVQDFLERVGVIHPECTEVYLTVHPQNKVAEALYRRFGFQATGHIIDGEHAYRLSLQQGAP